MQKHILQSMRLSDFDHFSTKNAKYETAEYAWSHQFWDVQKHVPKNMRLGEKHNFSAEHDKNDPQNGMQGGNMHFT